MLTTHNLRRFLTTPVTKSRDSRTNFWFSLSMIFTAIYISMGVREAFSSDLIFHDDVRSHVFWMRRFFDPELFPNDIIADYFSSVAPYGYNALYRLMASLGIDPVFFNKLLPIPLTFLTAIYCFYICLRILPIPAAGFIATLFLNQNIWSTHDVASGTPRAFLYPLFLAFIYYLIEKALFPCLITIALQGLFYPQCLFLSAAMLILRIFRCRNWRISFSRQSSDYIFGCAGLIVVAMMLFPYALKGSDFGPITTAATGKKLPILQVTGRKAFFTNNPWDFYCCGERSGMIPNDWCKYSPPPQAIIGLFLPSILKRSRQYSLSKEVSEHINVLVQILLASLGTFFFAHSVIFKMHLPSRYTKHSFRMLASIAAAIAIVIILDRLLEAYQQRIQINPQQSRYLPFVVLLPLIAILFCYPIVLKKFPNPSYVIAKDPPIYQFFTQQPKDILVASLSDKGNNIPTVSRRSILAGSETASPYHLGYYQQINRRTFDLMSIQYGGNLKEVQKLLQKYGIDFILIDRGAFTSGYINRYSWLREVKPFAQEAMRKLDRGMMPAIATLQDRCQVLKTEDSLILDAKCILKASS